MRNLTRDGTLWCVHEVDTSNVPGARACRCLLLESESVIRRVWSYPPNWSTLGDDTLWELLDHVCASRGAERTCLESHVLAGRGEMRDAALRYAAALREDGVPPERALVLLKAAVQRAISVSHCDEDVSEQLLHETVACCIAAYYAA